MVGEARVALLGALLLVACGSGGADDATGGAVGKPDDITSKSPTGADPGPTPITPEALAERPWEVVSKKGETYLGNVFYADPTENEQVMPWAIDGRTVIDRLVYPTIGNPNLFVKDDASDELVFVMRVEDSAFAHLGPVRGQASDTAPHELTLGEPDGFAFYLVSKSGRALGEAKTAATESDDVIRIRPKQILENAEPGDMPASLKRRHTLRFVFDAAAMANVKAGLYDARVEIKKGDAVFAGLAEWQSNAVRVFDHEDTSYTALNVTDTQVSTNALYGVLTADKIDDFVDNVNTSTDDTIKNAAFITFNGDLHNGGSPGTLRQKGVATTYNDEAKRILGALKRLNYPIFLTPGNHDGYVSTGNVPSAVATLDNTFGTNLQKVIDGQNNLAWPNYSWDSYAAFLAKAPMDGLHRDIVTGGFARTPGATFGSAFAEVAHDDRNMILYDGFHQWQKSYGPLQESWTFGKNRYVSMNTFELRQHRRTGWGMYTVNYGGNVSQAQLEWLDRELGRSELAQQDVVILMHHDPRGGHKGKDAGYYFPMLTYVGVQQSLVNYLYNEQFTPAVCKLDDVALTSDQRDSCIHDGLQEWMAPDAELDQGFMSGIELLTRIAKSPRVRTLLIGHAHLNSMEVLQGSDVLVPGKVNLDSASAQRLAWLEGSNPVRNGSWGARDHASEATSQTLMPNVAAHVAMLNDAMARPMALRTLSNGSDGPRELAILRLTSNADLSSEKYGAQSMFGFSVLHINEQAGGTPRINRISYMIHKGTDAFDRVETVDVDRTKSIGVKAPENRVAQLFTW